MLRQIESKQDLENLVKNDSCFVVFDTPWSAPCRLQLSILKKIGARQKKYTEFVNVNIDRYPDLARAYRINNIPTIIYFSKNRERKRYVGLQSETSILQMIGI